MKATSLLAMTAALSLLVGTSAAFAGGHNHTPQTNIVVVKQKIDTDLTINKNKVNQLAIVKNYDPSVSVIAVKNSDHLNNLTNINNIASNVANTGNISVKGYARTGNINGHGNSGSSVSAVGAAAGISISSISTSTHTHK